ncbi:MAG: double-strand break repair protein AddB [Oceanicola sp.]|nr:double-strand break repair protein AddB [Oceanicola sp.]
MTKLFSDTGPRIFGLPAGVDFPEQLIAGLDQRLSGQPQAAIARVTVFVNTQRMERRLTALYQQRSPCLMPRIKTLQQIPHLPQAAGLRPVTPPLQIRLELTEALSQLLQRAPDLAPRAALPDLAETLTALMDEMAGEGVDPAALDSLDMGAHAEHWQRSRLLLQAMADYAHRPDQLPGAEARLRAAVMAVQQGWQASPPGDPVLVAGSTASRGATRLFMEAVAALPQGGLVLPGFDFDQPEHVWQSLDASPHGPVPEDHPQARFRGLLRSLNLAPDDVRHWTDTPPAAPERNRLVSLALRPAPVTDQWLSDGPALRPQLARATEGLSLIEAPTPRDEAEAIAMAMRSAVAAGKTVALISPDRGLTRQVSTALDRWRIRPDDSAGLPLNQSAPGRLLREVAALEQERPALARVLGLLKNPLVCTASPRISRGQHLLWVRDVERRLRRDGYSQPTGAQLAKWARSEPLRQVWLDWLEDIVLSAPRSEAGAAVAVTQRLANHRARAEALCAGPEGTGSGALWEEQAGVDALALITELTEAAPHGGALNAADYGRLVTSLMSGREVRRSIDSHPGVIILGTLEARVQSADIVVLGGLNEQGWPEQPGPDPWLNRKMRAALGLLSPERRVGLSAHDFQQAVAGTSVILTRAKRGDEAETVPSRWLNRLTNLLGGLGADGARALADMRARGQRWLSLAAQLGDLEVAAMDAPERAGLTRATRPAPRPPTEQRPTAIAVTQVERLIRNPYETYARKILRLHPLDPLVPVADARVRGMLLHDAMAAVIRDGTPFPDGPAGIDALSQAMEQALENQQIDPALGQLWLAQFRVALPSFSAREQARAQGGTPQVVEQRISWRPPDCPITLTAQPDRIDRLSDGTFAIFDYKTTQPSRAQVVKFTKQLPLQAAMLEGGAFESIIGPGPATVSTMGYIGLGSSRTDTDIARYDKEDDLVADTWTGFLALMALYDQRSQGYQARQAMEKTTDSSDYDHLSRYGEWTESDPFDPEDVG